MTIMGWNCRSSGQLRTVQDLERLVRAHRPKLLFLCETRQNKNKIENLRWRLGLKNVLSFFEEGKGGGLALFWDESLDVDLLKLNSRVIDVMVRDHEKAINWRCTFVYGEPRTHLRHLFWNLLKDLKHMQKAPWLMLGDFNEALWPHEHFSKRKRNEKQMMQFRNTLSYCNLYDLGFQGLPWTYDNKQKGDKNVRVRLDRAVACPAWFNLFPNYHVRHLVSSRSDHCPILIQLDLKIAVPTAPKS
jgi:exonuclease III